MEPQATRGIDTIPVGSLAPPTAFPSFSFVFLRKPSQALVTSLIGTDSSFDGLEPSQLLRRELDGETARRGISSAELVVRRRTRGWWLFGSRKSPHCPLLHESALIVMGYKIPTNLKSFVPPRGVSASTRPTHDPCSETSLHIGEQHNGTPGRTRHNFILCFCVRKFVCRANA